MEKGYFDLQVDFLKQFKQIRQFVKSYKQSKIKPLHVACMIITFTDNTYMIINITDKTYLNITFTNNALMLICYTKKKKKTMCLKKLVGLKRFFCQQKF